MNRRKEKTVGVRKHWAFNILLFFILYSIHNAYRHFSYTFSLIRIEMVVRTFHFESGSLSTEAALLTIAEASVRWFLIFQCVFIFFSVWHNLYEFSDRIFISSIVYFSERWTNISYHKSIAVQWFQSSDVIWIDIDDITKIHSFHISIHWQRNVLFFFLFWLSYRVRYGISTKSNSRQKWDKISSIFFLLLQIVIVMNNYILNNKIGTLLVSHSH